MNLLFFFLLNVRLMLILLCSVKRHHSLDLRENFDNAHETPKGMIIKLMIETEYDKNNHYLN